MFDKIVPYTTLALEQDPHLKILRAGAYFHTLYNSLCIQFQNTLTISLEDTAAATLSILRSLGLLHSPVST